MASSLLAKEGDVAWSSKANNALSTPQLNGFRLTLTSGTAVTTSDVTGATTLYFTPYIGSRVCLYDGTNWSVYSTAEISIALGTLTSGKNYDVFVYDNNGTVTIDTLVAWTSDTARATAIVLQDGVWVKSGATTRRYVGTIRTTSTTATEDSAAKRFVFNAQNRVLRIATKVDATATWTETSTTYVAMDAGNAAWKFECVMGLNDFPVRVDTNVFSQAQATFAVRLSIGLDSTTAAAAKASKVWQGSSGQNSATYGDYVGLGYHFLNGIESVTGGTATIWGDDTTNHIRSAMYVESWA